MGEKYLHFSLLDIHIFYNYYIVIIIIIIILLLLLYCYYYYYYYYYTVIIIIIFVSFIITAQILQAKSNMVSQSVSMAAENTVQFCH